MPLLRHEDYTIAWIAILPIEVKVALAALDERHEGTFGVVRGDDYTYIGGEIAGHNVVIAKLPAGQQYGVGAAAALVNQVKTRFENIWFALLVGIAAGLPGVKDIRLGDVIVCVPDKHCTGIVHYDIGHDTEDGFVVNSRQAETPALVRSAIGDLQLMSDPFGSGNKLDVLLKEMAPERPEDTITAIKPNRRPRNAHTRVWYGRIGSGNSLMRNAKRRDELRDKYGLIGLEMEAAGVMNSLPTGVIRGVCDYGDGHKNDDWHGYAAAVAAVYAKALLQQMPAKIGGDQRLTSRVESAQIQHVMPFMRDPGFVGREAMGVIQEKMRPGTRVTLVGLGGVGKSQLAIEYCYRVMDRMQVLWFHASSATRLDQEVSSVVEDLKLPGHEGKSADTYKLLRDWLAGRECLVVLDNADDAEFLFKVPETSKRSTARIDYFKPQHGQVLITTRRLTIAQRVSSEQDIIHLNPEQDLAVELLKARLGLPHTPDLEKLAVALDHVPLAISQAAAYIKQRQPRCTVENYLHKLEKSERSRSSLLKVQAGSDELRRDRQEAENSILLTWQISFEHVRELRPSAADLLALMSFYDNQGVPDFLLRGVEQADDNDSGLEDDDEFEQDLVTLRDYSFVSVTTNATVLQMHRLVQLAAQVWLRKEPAEYERYQVQSLRKLVRQYPLPEFEHWGRCWVLQAHAKHMCAVDVTESGALILASLMDKAGSFADSQELYLEGETMKLRSLHIRQSHENHLGTLVSLSNLVSTYYNQGRHEQAVELGIEVVEAWKVRGLEDPRTLISMSSLARAYYRRGWYKEAEELGMTVLELRRKVLGEEHPDTLTSMNDLATTYFEQGRYEEGEELSILVVKGMKNTLGEHPHTLACMGTLSASYHAQGRYEEAERLRTSVVEISERVLGEESPATLDDMSALALTYLDQGRNKDAEGLIRRVLQIERRVLGDEHPDTLRAMYRLAVTLFHQSRLQEARQLMEGSAALRERVLGEAHPDVSEAAAFLELIDKQRRREARAADVQEGDCSV